MGSNISGCIKPVLDPIFSYVAGEAKYIWNLEDNLDVLDKEFDKLIRIRDDLVDDVKRAEQKPKMRRTNQVKGWLQRVRQLETKVGELQKIRSQELDRLCLCSFCSTDLMSSYDFGKRVVKLKQEVSILQEERGDLKEVADARPEDPAIEIPVKRRIVGQESTFENVWRCLRNDQVGIIGIYGISGVGKTTLLEQINNSFNSEKRHNFDVAIWVVLSREATIELIQNDIGERIGLLADSWKKKSIKDKALDIANILYQKKFVLLLDDTCEVIDLKAVGVPLQSLKIGSKIVLTARSCEVCSQMGVDEDIEMKCLEHDEAWRLFQHKVGKATLNFHPDIPELDEILARECGGLPLALITIAETMSSSKNPYEWKCAIGYLRSSTSEVSDMEEKLYSCLKFSYDYLSGEENEDAILDLKAKLYIFDEDGNQWKERGIGNIEILKHKETGKVRLIMREDETLKICANHLVLPTMKLREDGTKSCIWTGAFDIANGEPKFEAFGIRFKSAENCKTFMEMVLEAIESQKKERGE